MNRPVTRAIQPARNGVMEVEGFPGAFPPRRFCRRRKWDGRCRGSRPTKRSPRKIPMSTPAPRPGSEPGCPSPSCQRAMDASASPPLWAGVSRISAPASRRRSPGAGRAVPEEKGQGGRWSIPCPFRLLQEDQRCPTPREEPFPRPASWLRQRRAPFPGACSPAGRERRLR